MSSTLRPKFPGRLFPSTGRKRRIRSKTLELNVDCVKVGENVARGIQSFYNMLGSQSDDEVILSSTKIFMCNLPLQKSTMEIKASNKIKIRVYLEAFCIWKIIDRCD